MAIYVVGNYVKTRMVCLRQHCATTEEAAALALYHNLIEKNKNLRYYVREDSALGSLATQLAAALEAEG